MFLKVNRASQIIATYFWERLCSVNIIKTKWSLTSYYLSKKSILTSANYINKRKLHMHIIILKLLPHGMRSSSRRNKIIKTDTWLTRDRWNKIISINFVWHDRVGLYQTTIQMSFLRRTYIRLNWVTWNLLSPSKEHYVTKLEQNHLLFRPI